jgi:hypothetical protein
MRIYNAAHFGMCGRLRDPVPAEPTRPLPRLRVGSRQTRGHSPADSDICEPGSPAVRQRRARSASSYEQPSTILAWNSIRRSKHRGSHNKWEPTCSAALRRSTARSDSSHRSRAPSSTQSDSGRQLKRLRNSVTRKRSLVQIRFGPRDFSKTCLALKGPRGASHLRFCRFVASQSAPARGLIRELSGLAR